MLRPLFRTENSSILLIARVVAGGVLLPHGLQKTFGLFGGPGWQATLDSFAGMGIAVPIAVLVILAESLGAVGLIVGFLGRLCALGGLLVMGGAIQMVHWQHGFFMNWQGQQAGEGFEYHLLMMGLLLIVLIGGSGALSVDIGIAGRNRK